MGFAVELLVVEVPSVEDDPVFQEVLDLALDAAEEAGSIGSLASHVAEIEGLAYLKVSGFATGSKFPVELFGKRVQVFVFFRHHHFPYRK